MKTYLYHIRRNSKLVRKELFVKCDGRIPLLLLQIPAISFLVLLGCASTRQGKITGYVVNPDGGPTSGAVISLDGSRLHIQAVSGQDGKFVIELPHKTQACSLTVSKPGYAELTLMSQYYQLISDLSFKLLFHPAMPEARSSGFGVLTGHITDEKTGQSIPGATIIVESTQLGAAANISGIYRITNIPSGKYAVIAKIIGYAAIRYKPITIYPDSTTNLDFGMVSIPIYFRTGGHDAVPLIDKRVTSNKWELHKSKIEHNPAMEVDDLLKICPGLIR